MPTVTFTFNMPEEKNEFDMAYHGSDYLYCLQELDNELRSWIKYGHEFKTADEVLETVRQSLNDLMRDNDVSFI